MVFKASLQNIILDLEVFYYFLTQIDNEHHSFTTLLYQMMKQNFVPTTSM